MESMRRATMLGATAATLASLVFARPADADGAVDVAFESGLWFDGNRFVPRDVTYVSGGSFIPRPIDGNALSRVDLGGKFVVPPYGDANTHAFDGDALDDALALFLRSGVFYAQNTSDVPKLVTGVRSRIDREDSVDVTFAHAGFTSSGGYPSALARARYVDRLHALAPDELEGNAYWSIDTPSDLARVWPRVLGNRPDFIELYLVFSEEFDRRRRGPARARNGLDPALVAALASRARAAGLSAHAYVETANDVRVALAAGVGRIAGIPGSALPAPERAMQFRLEDADAARAANSGVVFTSTTAATTSSAAHLRAAIDRVHVANIATLRRHAVPIALGSDAPSATVLDEARRLSAIGAMTRAELLRALCVVTPQAIFPTRKLGVLAPGYEANFLVLDGDPTADLGALDAMSLRFKAGRPLIVPDLQRTSGVEMRTERGRVLLGT
jgi:hypothetical protein